MDDRQLINEEQGYRVKFVIVGDIKVGKTNIFNRYVYHKNEFEYKPTIGTNDNDDINIQTEKNIFVLKIRDISGMNEFIPTLKRECENANFVLVVFDVTNKDSFLSLNNWINHCRSSGNEKINFIIVGNKNDLINKRKVTEEEANSFAESNGMKYYDISAFNEEEVKKIFDEAFDSFHQEFLESNDPIAYRKTRIRSDYNIKLNTDKKKKSCCCY